MRQHRNGEQLGGRNSGGERPVDDTRDVQVIVNEEVLEADVVVVEGKAGDRMTDRTDHGGDDGVPEEMAREAILQSILARVHHSSKGRKVIPAICSGVVLGEVGVFLRDGNRRTEDMVSHWKLLGMSQEGYGEGGVIVCFVMKWTPREILNRFPVL